MSQQLGRSKIVLAELAIPSSIVVQLCAQFYAKLGELLRRGIWWEEVALHFVHGPILLLTIA
jgi:hypothetical protein